ncbi:hypothetical protein [Streptosporangium vulgare]|uniref:alpha/beta fold hydrolase n=1 Tax=Streptosporangium vulgare TaxID=46190 RepID=UPI0031D9AFCC
MTDPTTGRLRVDGATLHYEVRGSGPLLLLIPGGAGDAASYDGIADDLAADYTVASYDPRGLSRSPLEDPRSTQRVVRHADDAFRLLRLLSPDAPRARGRLQFRGDRRAAPAHRPSRADRTRGGA